MDVRVWFSICFIPYHMLYAASVRGKVLFANSTSIMEMDVDTQKVTVLVNHEDNQVYALDYDYQNRYVYFAAYVLSVILRFPYPSQNITLQYAVDTSPSPTGIAVDSANDHVYWVNEDSGKLSRCNLDGTNVVVLLTSLRDTFMLRLDVTNRWMYIGYLTTGISKSRFDLTDIKMIVNFTSSNPLSVCMDIDLTEQRLYWRNYNGDIKSVNVDGSDVKTITSTNCPSNEYFAMGVLGSYIYYADVKKLVMMNKSQVSTTTVMYTGTNRICSILTFDQTGMLITLKKDLQHLSIPEVTTCL